jgi:hypothetical protein
MNAPMWPCTWVHEMFWKIERKISFQKCQGMEISRIVSYKLWGPPCISPLSMKKILRILLGAHKRSCWWLLWRILGASSFTIIFGFIMISSINVFNSHFISSCILLCNLEYSTWHMYWHSCANIEHITICMSCIFEFHNSIPMT